MNRRIVDCVEVAHILSYVRSFKRSDKPLRAVHKSRRPWSRAKQRFRHTIRHGKIISTSETSVK